MKKVNTRKGERRIPYLRIRGGPSNATAKVLEVPLSLAPEVLLYAVPELALGVSEPQVLDRRHVRAAVIKGKAKQVKARQSKPKQGKAREGKAKQATARHGTARQRRRRTESRRQRGVRGRRSSFIIVRTMALPQSHEGRGVGYPTAAPFPARLDSSLS